MFSLHLTTSFLNFFKDFVALWAFVDNEQWTSGAERGKVTQKRVTSRELNLQPLQLDTASVYGPLVQPGEPYEPRNHSFHTNIAFSVSCMSACAYCHTDLSPNTSWVSYVPPAVGQLSDAVVDGHTAPPLTQVLFCHLHPAKRSHWKWLGDTHTHTHIIPSPFKICFVLIPLDKTIHSGENFLRTPDMVKVT